MITINGINVPTSCLQLVLYPNFGDYMYTCLHTHIIENKIDELIQVFLRAYHQLVNVQVGSFAALKVW